MSNYPNSLDNSISLPLSTDLVTEIRSVVVNNIRSATVAIEGELGVKPSGTYGTVKDRLDGVDETISLIQVGVIPQGNAGGDLSSTYPNPKVSGIQGIEVSSTTPLDGYSLVYELSSDMWIPARVSTDPATTISLGTIQLAGDLGGTSSAPSVLKVRGATVPASGSLTTGNGLYVTGASALSYSSLNLAGGANYVTGILPSANQASQTMTGDVTGTTAVSVVAKANGATIPSAGALVTGNGLYVSGVSALSYSALNLAGGANYVFGVLPVLNGGNHINQLSLLFFAGITNSSSITFVIGGTLILDRSLLSSSNSKTIKLRVVAETTGPLCSIQLYNLTTAAVVTGSALSTSSADPVTLTTGDLYANLSSGLAVYQVQMNMGSGSLSDRVNLDFAELLVEWS